MSQAVRGRAWGETQLRGKSLGFRDVALVPYYSWFFSYETSRNFSIETECLKLVSWAERCLGKESISKSLPDQEKVYGFASEIKKFGVE